ncbi:MAG: enoyl-CoA hydratase-related protein, partial [Pseudomonadota bacterium]
MAYLQILYDLSDDVATITLNRPEQLNGMTSQMRAEINDAIRRAQAEARVLVLTGAGRGFCSGQDLGGAGKADDIDTAQVLREEYEPILRLIENMTLGRNAVGYLTESMHGAGSPQAQRIQIARGLGLAAKKALA